MNSRSTDFDLDGNHQTSEERVDELRERLQEKNAILMAYAEHGTPEEVAYALEYLNAAVKAARRALTTIRLRLNDGDEIGLGARFLLVQAADNALAELEHKAG
jgi:hypothetical protein